MGIEFSSFITLRDVDLGEVTDTSNLDVVLGLDKVHTLERSVGDHTSSTTRLCAPSNLLTLSITDRARAGRSPEAEVVNVVDPEGLAHGRLRRGSATLVSARLAVLGGLWRVGGEVAGVPGLVGVPVAAAPDLYLVSVVHAAVGEVHALA